MGGAASHHDNELVLDVLGLSEPAFAVNGSHQIVAWNDGAERLLGLRAEEMIGRRCYEALSVRNSSLCMACRFHPDNVASTMPSAEGTAPAQSAAARARKSAKQDGNKRINMTTLAAHTRAGQMRLVHLLHDLPAIQSAPDEAPSASTAQALSRQDRASSMLIRCDPVPVGQVGQVSDPVEAGMRRRRPMTLTQRELEVLRLLGAGHSTDDIARELSITRVTARNHVNKVLDKLGVNSRLQAVVIASQLQLI
ncbi:MAG TPA: LuxR C-terminal-related transcriptional regulator [Ktedonobacterales bacterium]|jgi:DNA-binding CsgD family transcriptional regulator|nr:LuxR C-terminal-related transcriptional regulator [Ktedonobacterales bacterium]